MRAGRRPTTGRHDRAGGKSRHADDALTETLSGPALAVLATLAVWRQPRQTPQGSGGTVELIAGNGQVRASGPLGLLPSAGQRTAVMLHRLLSIHRGVVAMKNLIICLDGTWSDADSAAPIE